MKTCLDTICDPFWLMCFPPLIFNAELCLRWRDAGEEQVVMLGAAARLV